MRQTPQEKQAGLKWLCQDGNSPEDVYRRFDKISQLMGREDFLSQPGFHHEREAFSAARFGQARKAKYIRKLEADFPDFEVTYSDGSLQQIEIVFTDRKDRKLAEDHLGEPQFIHPDYLRTNEALDALWRACQRKVEKNYSDQSCALLIYLNGFWILKQEHKRCLVAGTKTGHKSFKEIYVHDGYGITRAWKNGRPAYKRYWSNAPNRRKLAADNELFHEVFGNGS